MNRIYDAIIIGSGPAGLTAAIYAKRAQLDFIIIEKMGMSGGQILNTYEVDNYPGFPGINGFDLGIKFREHADKLGTSFVMNEVISITFEDNLKVVQLDNNVTYKTKTLIIATGASHRKLNVKGEEELCGMGVSYCATCDGAFFKDKDVAVIGGGNVAVEDAIYLSRICKKVYVIHRRDELRAAKILSNKLISLNNTEIIWNSIVTEINGDDNVSSLTIKNVETNSYNTLNVNGVFIAVGTLPNSDLFKELVSTNNNGYIIAGEDCKTNIPGVFAAGDVRSKQVKQIITAAADGANAVISAERYLLEQ